MAPSYPKNVYEKKKAPRKQEPAGTSLCGSRKNRIIANLIYFLWKWKLFWENYGEERDPRPNCYRSGILILRSIMFLEINQIIFFICDERRKKTVEPHSHAFLRCVRLALLCYATLLHFSFIIHVKY